MKSQKLFPTFIYKSKLSSQNNIDKINKELKVEAYQIKKVDLTGQKWSAKNYLGGYTSYGSMSRLDQFSSTFNDLKKYLDKHVNNFIKELEYDVQKDSIQLTSLWLNIMPAHVVHTNHIHPLSVISGTYYLQMPPKASAIKFEDPRLNFFMAAPPKKTKVNSDQLRHVSVQAQSGEIVLFESWLRHEVPPSTNSKDRISISFNYDWC